VAPRLRRPVADVVEPRADSDPVTEPWPELYELAASYGVATEYHDWQGTHTIVSAETIISVLAALGVDASTREATEVALYFRWLNRWQRMLPACVVTRQGWSPWFGVHVDHGADVTVWIETEDGSRRHDVHQQDHWINPEMVAGRLVGEATFAVPGDLPTGYHWLVAESGTVRARCPLIVTPAWVGLPAAVHERRTWGLALQLYSVRSRRSWGTGDLADLADLTTWAGARHGAGFVLVNPLHAAEPVAPMEPSPYLPSTRRFVNPLYLRVEEIEEYAYLEDAARRAIDAAARPRQGDRPEDGRGRRRTGLEEQEERRQPAELPRRAERDERRIADEEARGHREHDGRAPAPEAGDHELCQREAEPADDEDPPAGGVTHGRSPRPPGSAPGPSSARPPGCPP